MLTISLNICRRSNHVRKYCDLFSFYHKCSTSVPANNALAWVFQNRDREKVCAALIGLVLMTDSLFTYKRWIFVSSEPKDIKPYFLNASDEPITQQNFIPQPSCPLFFSFVLSVLHFSISVWNSSCGSPLLSRWFLPISWPLPFPTPSFSALLHPFLLSRSPLFLL